MNMISAERLLGKNETGAPRAFMKESMELRVPLRIIKMLSIRSMATSQEEFLERNYIPTQKLMLIQLINTIENHV